MRTVVLILAFVIVSASGASARTHHRHHHFTHHRHHARRAQVPAPESMFQFSWPAVQTAVTTATEGVTRYLPHPSGCPSRAFCGCGAAQEIGKAGDRSLWLARSWFKFPRTSPAPGMAAVRSHHVFVLREQINGNVWLVADYNSGGHQSRLHARSIAGYAIVNPGS